MYKAAVRWMIRRNIGQLNRGDYASTLSMFRPDAILSFPGDNSWSTMIRPTQPGRDPFATHRGVVEIEQFLQRYVDQKMHMVVDDILVNGPPWNTRAAFESTTGWPALMATTSTQIERCFRTHQLGQDPHPRRLRRHRASGDLRPHPGRDSLD